MIKSNFGEIGKRVSGFELLRIICMFFIIMSHYLLHGIEKVSHADVPQWSILIYPLAYVANNVFFLITGYFLHKTVFSFQKLVSLVVHILLINYFLLCVNLLVFKEWSLSIIVRQVFPITSNLNWFLSIYVFIYAMGPFLKSLVLYLRENRKIFVSLVCFLLFFNSILGFITPLNTYATSMMEGVTIVLLGAWIEQNKVRIEAFRPALLISAGYGLAIIFTLCLRFVAKFIPVLVNFDWHFRSNSSPLIILSAVGLVLLFGKMKFHSGIINVIASSIMTIYLVHDNGCFKNHIWFDFLHVQDHLAEIAQYMFICVAIIMCVGILFDFIIKRTIHHWVMRIISKPVEYISNWLSRSGVPY